MAINVDQSRGLIDDTQPYAQGPESELLSLWSRRRTQALHQRRKFEPTWAMAENFVAGHQWVMWDGKGGRGIGRVVSEPNVQKRERFTSNVLTQYIETMLGKLFAEDLRPTILFTREDAESENITSHTRSVARHMWEVEIGAEQQLYDVVRQLLVYGTSAVRCYFDTSKGRELGQFPIGPDGQLIIDPMQARAFVAQMQELGQTAQFETLKEGKVQWEVLSPRQMLVPPGIAREHNFPWIIIERPLPLSDVQQKWPDTGGKVSSSELQATDYLGVSPEVISEEGSAPSGAGKLKDHVLVSTGYCRPEADYPHGYVINWVASQGIVLGKEDTLPHKLRSEPHNGIVFFHYRRLPQRFQGRGMVEDMIGPQRQRNRARSQMIEMKDRNLGRVYAKKGTITAANKPVGKIMELIEIPLHADFPQENQGVPPGPWIENEARMNDEDMERIAGLREVSMGGAPPGVSAYSSMALLAEQDERRIGPTMKMLRIGIAELTVISLELARRYWQDGKHFAIAGLSGQLEMYTFMKGNLPLEFYAEVSRHSPLPTSPAVESQKIFDLFHAATSAGQPLPVEWLEQSLEQGRALPIPKREEQVQTGMAELENTMLARGEMLMPNYYDDDFVHIMSHRQAQMEFMGQPQMQQVFEYHIQMHVQNAQMKHPTQAGNKVPQMQGGHGAEAQNAPNVNSEAAATSAAGEAPLRQPSQ